MYEYSFCVYACAASRGSNVQVASQIRHLGPAIHRGPFPAGAHNHCRWRGSLAYHRSDPAHDARIATAGVEARAREGRGGTVLAAGGAGRAEEDAEGHGAGEEGGAG